MKIHEYQAAEILRQAGIPVPLGALAMTVDQAVAFAGKAGYPVVLKSQVLVGGRGKAGGIKVVRDQNDLTEKFTALKKLVIKDYLVEKVYVVKAVNIKKEYYVAVTVDSAAGDVVVIASASGGVDIEEVAKTNPTAIQKLYLDGKKTADEGKLAQFVATLFSDSKQQATAAKIFKALIQVFYDNDCSLSEINPLVIDDKGELIAADAKIIFDDNGMIRHEALEVLRDMTYEQPDELEAKQKGLSFVKLEGNVGCIVNGAGLAMATMDIVKLLGGQPDNFLDVGGSSNPEKVLNALKIILRNKDIKAILINIFGGITRCDDIAKGILQAKSQIDMKVPLVVRLTGTNEKEAKDLLSQNGITTYATMREAVQKVVELAK